MSRISVAESHLLAAVVAGLIAAGAGPAAAQTSDSSTTAAPTTAAPTTADPTTAASTANPLGTATATAGRVDLDLRLLSDLLDPLRLGGSGGGLDVPLGGLVLGQASAPTPDGDAANFTNSTLRVRDGLISTLGLSGDSADLLKADVASGTARVVRGPGAFAQAYATVANLRLFLPLLTLPGADASNGILKIDAVSAQATCVPGRTPSASAKTPATILLLGRQIPVPLSGDVPLDLGAAKVDVHLSPVTTTSASGAAASVEARISVDAAGLAQAGGAIVLASAACTSPAAVGAVSGPGTSTSPAGRSGGQPSAGGRAAVGGQDAAGGRSLGGQAGANGQAAGTQSAGGMDQGLATRATTGDAVGLPTGIPAGLAADVPRLPMADTGAPGSLVPALGGALAAVLGGAYLLRRIRRRRAASEAPASLPGRPHPHRRRA